MTRFIAFITRSNSTTDFPGVGGGGGALLPGVNHVKQVHITR